MSIGLVMSGEKVGFVFKDAIAAFWFRLLLASRCFWILFFFAVT